MKNLYKVLHSSPCDSAVMLHEAFIDLSRKLHPDAGGDVEAFQELTEAWGVLKNTDARATHDKLLSMKLAQCSVCKGTGRRRIQTSFVSIRQVQCKQCGGAGYL